MEYKIYQNRHKIADTGFIKNDYEVLFPQSVDEAILYTGDTTIGSPALFAEESEEEIKTVSQVLDYILSDEFNKNIVDDTESNAAAIEALRKYIGELPADATAQNVISYINEKVKSVDLRDIVEKMNGDSTVEGSIANQIKNAKENLEQQIVDSEYDDTELRNRLSTTETKLFILNGSGTGSVSKQISDAKEELRQEIEDSMYDDSELIDMIIGNENAIDTLNGSETTNGSVKKQISDAKAELRQEIIDFTYDDSALVGRISSAENAISTLNGSVTTNGSVAKQIKDAKTELEGKIEASKYNDSALSGRVTANTNAINVLNGTGVGSVKKQIADAKSELSSRITNAENKITTLNGTGDGSVKKQIADVKAELETKINNCGYDDAPVKARITANENAIAILNGDVTQNGSVKKMAADEVAKIVAGADAKYDTLKETSDWITSHTNSAATMNSQITTNKNNIATNKTNLSNLTKLVGTLPSGITSTTVVGYIKEAIDKSYVDFTADIADARQDAIDLVNTTKNTLNGTISSTKKELTTSISTAKQDAIATASADATSKANKALADAKAYTDKLKLEIDKHAPAFTEATSLIEVFSGDSISTIVGKLAKDIKETKALKSTIGTASISGIGDGTIKGAIKQLHDEFTSNYGEIVTVLDAVNRTVV